MQKPHDDAAAARAAGEDASSSLDATRAYEDTQTSPPTPASPSAPKKSAAKSQKKVTLGDFRLLKKLGAGGMGAVYKAHQISLDRDVALKVLGKALVDKPGFVERFYREARTMARLDHPNIVRGYAVGEEQGWHYVAMEFIDGSTILDWLKRLGKLSVADALHAILRCCEALEHAHEHNLIHRDIKPENVLVTRKGVVKVADLGLAKVLDDDLSLTQSGTGFGTPSYMPPEQARSAKHVDGRCDIYALGVTLYHLLTGELPFKGETVVDVIKAKEKGQFTPARRFSPEVPERLDLILDKMMAKEPQYRYQTCAELIRDLAALSLDGPALSFVAGAVPQGGRPQAAAAASETKASAPATKPKGAAAQQTLFVRFNTAPGKTVVRQVPVAQLKKLIKSEQFDVTTATACPTRNGKFRPLGQFEQLEDVVRYRMVKQQSDVKATRFQDMYQDIAKQDRRRRRWRSARNFLRGVTGWVGLLLILGGAAAVVYFAIQYFGGEIGEVGNYIRNAQGR